ncbi:MAG: nucleotidyltransferase substrate binding protein [Coriobacteriales bacterium]|jgi:nucleotidyltransferase substrate binding protein (TIGR01987 family)|nr:nucleotidyltransferase substrate binding protein [Coriobacteriales bacterium]
MENKDVRWFQRFQNFSRAFALLSEITNYDAEQMENLQKEGFIQRFEIVFDLAWKTVKDYLEYLGHDVQPSPRPVIKMAFEAGIIKDGQAFINMLAARNAMSHTYDEESFANIFTQIKDEFFPALRKLYVFLKKETS